MSKEEKKAQRFALKERADNYRNIFNNYSHTIEHKNNLNERITHADTKHFQEYILRNRLTTVNSFAKIMEQYNNSSVFGQQKMLEQALERQYKIENHEFDKKPQRFRYLNPLKILPDNIADSLNFRPTENAIRGSLFSFSANIPYNLRNETKDIEAFSREAAYSISNLLRENPNTKVSIVGLVKMNKQNNEETDTVDININTKQLINTGYISEEEITNHIVESFNNNIEHMQGSNWSVYSVDKLSVKFSKYNPLSASKYVELPEWIRLKNAVVNLKNNDPYCAIWCTALHQFLKVKTTKDYSPLSQYKTYFNDIKNKCQDIQFPLEVDQMHKFEKVVECNINIFCVNKQSIDICKISESDYADVIDLLIYENHYSYIKNMSRLITKQRGHRAVKSHLCRRCLQNFYTQDLLDAHTKLCTKHKVQKVIMPESNTFVEFKDYANIDKMPIVIYADFESILIPETENKGESTEIISRHEPSGFCFNIVDSYNNTNKIIQYRGSDSGKKFINMLFEAAYPYYDKLTQNKDMIFTKDDETLHNNTNICRFCENPCVTKVRDHCHYTGKFRGAACSQCNINARKTRFIPVVFHGLQNYDSHHILKYLNLEKYPKTKINVIANSSEKYLSFNIGYFKFIDSFNFLNESIETLTKNLAEDNINAFKMTKAEFKENTHLMLQKGFYPYEYITSHEILEQVVPCKPEDFNNYLNDSSINESEYKHYMNVWQTFNIKNLGEYHDLYCKSDVLLLSDIFENFRNNCHNSYKLDPLHYITLPAFSWSAMLKMTKSKIELLSDNSQFLQFESMKRGGLAQVSNRYFKANFPEMTDYNPNEPNSYIMDLDANALYSWAMCQPLPIGNFKDVEPSEAILNKILNCKVDSEIGYIVTVDLKYPKKLHDLHDDYPLAPENIDVNKQKCSEYTTLLTNKCGISRNNPSIKLTTNLHDKIEYTCHYRNLQLYTDLGMIVTALHRVISFKQTPFMRPYIELNMKMRQNASTKAEKDLRKLACNSIFGKTMENLRQRMSFKLIHTSEDKQQKLLNKYVSKPEFDGFSIFSENLAGLHMKKQGITFDKPSYVGICILDISKTLMYEFYYKTLKKRYGLNIRLLSTDTDSLKIHVTTPNIYNDFKQMENYFDFSDYPKDHFLYSTLNKKVAGKFKDELNSKPIIEFVGLKAKMYSQLTSTISKIVAKGVKKSVINNELTHLNFKNCLENDIIYRHDMKAIRSYNHTIYTQCQNKISLSSYDDKRYYYKENDKVMSHSYGHYSIV